MYCFSASFCFLCLKHYPKSELLDINKNHIQNTRIVEVLQVCGIDSNYCDDTYQVYICEECVKKVEPFYAFKIKCSENFTKLRGYVNQMKANTSVAFHANLKVLLSDPKYVDNNNETTIEYMDMSQFLEAQIQTDEMEQETPKECDKPPEICDNPDGDNAIAGQNSPLNNEQMYEMSNLFYENHFLNGPQIDYSEVIEIASSPESCIDISQNSSGSFNDDESSKHRCHTCSKHFSTPILLSIHTFLHTLITYPNNEASKCMKYYCALCTLDLTGLAVIKKHLVVHSFDKLSTCKFCKQDFMSTIDYNKHLTMHPTHKPFACEICECRFVSRRKLRAHMISKHVISCVFCKICFKDKKELKAHMKEKHNSKYCYICATSFESNDCLKIHLFDNHFELQTRGREGKPQYICTKCKATFLTKYSLNEHLGGCGDNAANTKS